VTKAALDDKSWIFRTFLLVAQLEPEGIPKRLKAARKGCGREMTQERVADVLGVHKRTIENDEKTASAGVWERLTAYSKLYATPIERLLWDDVELIEPGGPFADRLGSLEAKVDEQGHEMALALRALAKEVRARAPVEAPGVRPAKRRAR
jgi:DNA-binding XRE family transcriptional regulator